MLSKPEVIVPPSLPQHVNHRLMEEQAMRQALELASRDKSKDDTPARCVRFACRRSNARSAVRLSAHVAIL